MGRQSYSHEVIAKRLPVVGVMGSGSRPHRERSQRVGKWLARQGVHLLTGGGSGVMAEVSRAFCEVQPREGCVIGVIPCIDANQPRIPKPGYPNPWVEIPVFTHLPVSGPAGTELLSRNHINVLMSTLVIALPGSEGTASEVELAVRYETPVIAYLDSPDQIQGLATPVRIEPDWERLKQFVLSVIADP